MKKITVKRFLNKKLKPLEVYKDLELGYPLYYSITYNRKTQHIKSLCGAVMTQKAFEYLEQTGEPLNYETNYQITYIKVNLKDELFLITKALELIINNEKLDNVLDPDFVPRLKEFFQELRESLYFEGWAKFMHNLDPKEKIIPKKLKSYTFEQLQKIKPQKKELDFENIYSFLGENKGFYYAQQFYYCFNQSQNLLYSITVLSEVLKIDISKFIYIDTLKFWQVISLIERVHERQNLIEFVLSFDENKYIALNKKQGYNLTEEEIKIISNRLKNRVLNISHWE